jgi:hypothetical protein
LRGKAAVVQDAARSDGSVSYDADIGVRGFAYAVNGSVISGATINSGGALTIGSGGDVDSGAIGGVDSSSLVEYGGLKSVSLGGVDRGVGIAAAGEDVSLPPNAESAAPLVETTSLPRRPQTSAQGNSRARRT